MQKVKVLFLIMMIMEGLLFLLDGASLIVTFALNNELFQDSTVSGVFEISYLFLHLVLIAIIFYLTFRAYMKGSNIFAAFMMKDRNEKNITSIVIMSILAVFSLSLAVYSILIVFGLEVPLFNYINSIAAHSIMNAMLLLFMVSISALIFTFLYKEDKDFVPEVDRDKYINKENKGGENS